MCFNKVALLRRDANLFRLVGLEQNRFGFRKKTMRRQAFTQPQSQVSIQSPDEVLIGWLYPQLGVPAGSWSITTGSSRFTPYEPPWDFHRSVACPCP